ncbi:MAG: helix-turn-helix transcriptional regulator [Waterburya sp.]
MSPVAPSVTCHPDKGSIFKSQVTASKLQKLGMFKIQMINARVLSPEPREYYSVTVPLHNAFEIVHRNQTVDFHSTQAHIQNCDESFDLRVHKPCSMLVVNIEQLYFNNHAQKFYAGESFQEIKFDSILSLTTQSGASFWRYLSFLWHEIEQDGFLLHSPLALQEFENALLGLLLSSRLENSHNHELLQVKDCSSIYVRRVEEYLMEHLSSPVSAADMAEIAEVSARTLSRAFKKYCGKTPRQFLKERRLEACNRALLAADSQTSSVIDIALKYGFSHLGRFAIEHRKRFQELPSETLRRRSKKSIISIILCTVTI